jgi:tetratricopeptide (TPR) repeat protein
VSAALLGWVPEGLDWAGRTLDPVWTILGTVVAPIVAAIIAVALLWFVRKLRLRWRGRSPRVQITTFAWTAADAEIHDAAWVTSLFREQLAALRLDALDPLPERAPGAPLVEIVEGVGQGVGRGLDLGKAIGRLFRAAWPDAAYEVWGTLRPQDDGGCRISVQLVDRAHGNQTLISENLAESSWELGAEQAAMAVAGALYPRVRAAYKGPWSQWTETVPRRLIGDYHRALGFETENRLEEALGAYHSALTLDPLNPQLRISIAMLQERLALYLDAWVTYGAVIAESDRRAWKGAERRVRLIALYRLAILLGNGQVAEQWTKRDSDSRNRSDRRDTERDERRKELRMALERDRLFSRNAIPVSERIHKAPATGLLKALLGVKPSTEDAQTAVRARFEAGKQDTEPQRSARTQGINEVLEILSLQRLEELDAWLRLRPPSRPRQYLDWWKHRPQPRGLLRRHELSRSAVRVSKLLARISIAASSERRLLDGKGDQEAALASVRSAHKSLTAQWPFPRTGRIARWIARAARPRLRLANGRADAWQLHYNAACATAAVLLKGSVMRNAKADGVPRSSVLPGKTTEDGIVARAVAELEEYAHRAGSSRVAAQTDWVAIDDPDLEGLSQRAEFTLWANHHLPHGLPKKRAQRHVDVNRYTARIIHHGARAFADAWRKRAEVEAASAAEVADWWRQEWDAWTWLAEVCQELRSWRHRLKALEALQGWFEAAGRAEPVQWGHENRSRTVLAGELQMRLFREIAKTVDGHGTLGNPVPTPVLSWVRNRFEHVQQAYELGAATVDDGRLLAGQEREEALRAARIWTRLAETLEAKLHEPAASQRARRRGMEAPLLSIQQEISGDLKPRRAPPGRLFAERSRRTGRGRGRALRRRRKGWQRSG